MTTSDEELLIQCDSVLSLVLYRESDGLTEQTKLEVRNLITKLRRRTDAIVATRREENH